MCIDGNGSVKQKNHLYYKGSEFVHVCYADDTKNGHPPPASLPSQQKQDHVVPLLTKDTWNIDLDGTKSPLFFFPISSMQVSAISFTG